MITEKDLNEIGLWQYGDTHWFGDMEDIRYNIKTGQLWRLDCVEGDNEFVCTALDIEDLKQKIWDSFPYLRKQLNLG